VLGPTSHEVRSYKARLVRPPTFTAARIARAPVSAWNDHEPWLRVPREPPNPADGPPWTFRYFELICFDVAPNGR
jgi:hypothetical protein